MNDLPGALTAVTLFVDDLAAAKAFPLEVFGVPVRDPAGHLGEIAHSGAMRARGGRL